MDRIKQFLKRPSLRRSIVSYITAFTLLALLLIFLTFQVCDLLDTRIREKNQPASWGRYYLTDEDGNRLGGEGILISRDIPVLSERDERLLSALRVLPALLAPVWSALCILAAALLFYRKKLKTPLGLLQNASARISADDLDFHVDWPSGDEMGRLCASFEKMRAALWENHLTMSRQLEERKCLNAAFAHDLRTPLTVLKGHGEMLEARPEPDVQKAAAAILRQVTRLEHYADSMHRLQRLEETAPLPRPVEAAALAAGLEDSGCTLCGQQEKSFRFENRLSGSAPDAVRVLKLDADFVSQVCLNLLDNAARFARSAVGLTLSEADGFLLLTAGDDGPGFTPEALRRADEPYFSAEKAAGKHFGLGLYICRLLCERHGGFLKLENTGDGALATAAFRLL